MSASLSQTFCILFSKNKLQKNVPQKTGQNGHLTQVVKYYAVAAQGKPRTTLHF